MPIDLVGSQGIQSQAVTRMSAGETTKKSKEAMEVQDGTNVGNQVKEMQHEENPPQEPNEKQVKAAVDGVNSKLKMTKTRCEFSVHESTNRISIKIIDKETDELIREVPPEKTLEMIEKAWEIAGLLVDEKR